MAESVFIAGMFVKYGKEFEELCERTGHTELAKEAGKAVAVFMPIVTRMRRKEKK